MTFACVAFPPPMKSCLTGFLLYYSELGWGIKRGRGETGRGGWGTLCETTLSFSRVFTIARTEKAPGALFAKSRVWQRIAACSRFGLMADNNSDERRLDPRIYYDLPLNSLKPSVPFFLLHFIGFKIQLSHPPRWGWCRDGEEIYLSSSHQVHHQFIATDCVRIHVAMDAIAPKGMK
jgi:hypothetical protein